MLVAEIRSSFYQSIYGADLCASMMALEAGIPKEAPFQKKPDTFNF